MHSYLANAQHSGIHNFVQAHLAPEVSSYAKTLVETEADAPNAEQSIQSNESIPRYLPTL